MISIVRLSKFSIFLAAYIILSASFALQVWSVWKRIFGLNTLISAFILMCLWIFFAVLYKGIKCRIGIIRIFLLLLFSVSAFVFAWRQPYMPEKMHVVEYGILAWFSMRDLSPDGKNRLSNMLRVFIFVLITGILDEGLQKLLPWRVFEVRDILTNAVSAILGITLFAITAK